MNTPKPKDKRAYTIKIIPHQNEDVRSARLPIQIIKYGLGSLAAAIILFIGSFCYVTYEMFSIHRDETEVKELRQVNVSQQEQLLQLTKKPLKMFLDYVDGKVVDDGFIKEIDNEIQAAKNRDEWRREYMTLEMEIKRREKASFTEGKLEGKLDSYRKMIASGLVTIEQIIASGQLNSKEIAALK